ncbi:FAD-dependent oxidoreductase [Nocardia sp. NPDC049190]|uniref:NAD(P)/FAD-dependent oxidoreductase n=1 Tax=Nocardia sp. NPDC049190 TaxID=3155650 RepID=UPI0033D90DC5
MIEHTEWDTTAIRRVAVIGSGVAGLTAAWVLAASAEVTLYEADSRLGGHADTHRVTADNGEIVGLDTGFIVHNDRTYPTLLRLFGELGIATQDSDMSMSVRCDGCGLQYAGARGLGGLFASPRSLVRGRYLRLLAEVPRWHRLARAELDSGGDSERTLGEFVRAAGFSDYFVAHFLTPLVAAVWSCDPRTALRYPARYLLTFLDHHGMLTVSGSPTWRTVTGGSATYVHAIANRLDHVLVATPVRAVHRLVDAVVIRDDADEVQVFDAVVIATHPAQALRLLAEPTRAEREILTAMPYSVNHAVLHTDSSVLPNAPRAQASWNYRLPSCTAAVDRVLVSYDLTRLQRLHRTGDRRFIVTLGDHDRVDRVAVLDRMVYEHPTYTPESVDAQRRLREIGSPRVAFAGAYHGWGFHEDGAASGLRAAARLGARWGAPTAAQVLTT